MKQRRSKAKPKAKNRQSVSRAVTMPTYKMKTRSRTVKKPQEKKVNTKAGNCIRLFGSKPTTDTLLQISTSVKVYSCKQCDAIFLSASEYEKHKKSHPLGTIQSPHTSKDNTDNSSSDKQKRRVTATRKRDVDEHTSAAANLLQSYPNTKHQQDAPSNSKSAPPSNTKSVTPPKSQKDRAPQVKSAPIIRQAKPVAKGPPQRKHTEEDDDPWGPSAWERRWGKEDESMSVSDDEQNVEKSSSSTQNAEVVSKCSQTPKSELVISKVVSLATNFSKQEGKAKQQEKTGNEALEQIKSGIKEQNVSGAELQHSSQVIEDVATVQQDSLSPMPDHIEQSDNDSEHNSTAEDDCQQATAEESTASVSVDPEEHAYTTSPVRAKLQPCPMCGKYFLDPTALKLHVLVHANDKSHVCNHCGKSYTLETNLIAHLKTHTEERPNTCTKCNKAFGSPLELRTHFKSHCFENPYVCSYCDVGFATGDELTVHMKNTHTGKDPLRAQHCEQCGGTCQAKPKVVVDKSQKPYVVRIISQGTCKPIKKPEEPAKKPQIIKPFKGISDSVDLEKWKVKAPPVVKKPEPMKIFPVNEAAKQPYMRPYACKYCDERFHESIDMRRHIRIHTGKNFHQCTICLKRFYQITQLKRHIQTHTGEKPYKCAHCDADFVCKYDLNQHLFIHSSEKVYKCWECKKIFRQKNNLIVHRRIKHSHRKLHICVECGASFAFSWKLKKHVRNHTGERLYVCSQCEMTFKTSTALRMHRMTHAGIKAHTCPYCEKGFVRVSSLKLHIRRHEGNKPYLCAVCGKAFLTQSRLNLHGQLHSGVKPFECTYGCGKSFHTPAYLRSHIKRHTGEKPYLCTHCGKGFSQSGNLRVHVKAVHDNGNRHNECVVCEKVFVTQYLLDRHMGTHATHPCELCSSVFNIRGLLYRHMRNVHKLEIHPEGLLGPRIRPTSSDIQVFKPPPAPKERHECSICKKVFVGNYLFQRHMGTHDTHQCKICGNVLTKRSVLYKHMRKVHKVEIEPLGKLGPHVKHNLKRPLQTQAQPAETQVPQSSVSSQPDGVIVIQPLALRSDAPMSSQIIHPAPSQHHAERPMAQLPAVRMTSILQSSQPSGQPSGSHREQVQVGTHTVNAPHILSQSTSPYVQQSAPKMQHNILNPQPRTQVIHPHQIQSHQIGKQSNPQPRTQVIHPHQIQSHQIGKQSNPQPRTEVIYSRRIQPHQIGKQSNPQPRTQVIHPHQIQSHQIGKQSNSHPRTQIIHPHQIQSHQIGKQSNQLVVRTSGLQITSDKPVNLIKPQSVQALQGEYKSNLNTLNPHIRPYPIPQPQTTTQPSPSKPDTNSNPQVPSIRIRVKQPHGYPSPSHSSGRKNKTKTISECVYCGINFSRTTDLVEHVKMHTGHNPYKCQVCGKAFITAAFLERHQCNQ